VLVGVRPEYFEDASLVGEERAARGSVVRARVDVTEWLGNELFAYCPYEAPEDVANRLRKLSLELDSDQLRTQAVVRLDPSSLITDGDEAELWIDVSRIHIFDPATGVNLTRDEERVAALNRHADKLQAAQRRAQQEPSPDGNGARADADADAAPSEDEPALSKDKSAPSDGKQSPEPA